MTGVFITGGAGFIGRRLAAKLRKDGREVSVYDNLHPQVQSDPAASVRELRELGCTVVEADIRDAARLEEELQRSGCSTVVHLAAETGTGQSYDIPAHYCEVNVTGTAHLVEAVRRLRKGGQRIDRVLLAGSRAVYGEGAARTSDWQEITAVPRLSRDMEAGDFAPKDAAGENVEPVASSAAKTEPAPASVYASSKLMQEYVLQQGLEQTGIGCGILRLQNVYGAGQALHNPYTGVLSIFSQQLLDGKTLNIFEDGDIVRDFVHVDDVAEAFFKLCTIDSVPTEVIDIGSGEGSSIVDVARILIGALGLPEDRYRISGDFRPGDIRHARADTGAASDLLEWSASTSLDEGLTGLVEWARAEQ